MSVDARLPCRLLSLPVELQQGIVQHLIDPFSLRSQQTRVRRAPGDLGASLEAGSYNLALKIFAEQQQDLLALYLTCKALGQLVRATIASFHNNSSNYSGYLRLRDGFPKYISSAVLSLDTHSFANGLKLADTDRDENARYDTGTVQFLWLRNATTTVSLPFNTRGDRLEVMMAICRLQETFPNLQNVVIEIEPSMGDLDKACEWDLSIWQDWFYEFFDFYPRNVPGDLHRQCIRDLVRVLLRVVMHHSHQQKTWDLEDPTARYSHHYRCTHASIAMFELMGFLGQHVPQPNAPVLRPLQSTCIAKEKEIVSSAPPPPGLGLSASQKCSVRAKTNNAIRAMRNDTDELTVLLWDVKSKEEKPSADASSNAAEQESHQPFRSRPLPYRKPEDGQGRR